MVKPRRLDQIVFFDSRVIGISHAKKFAQVKGYLDSMADRGVIANQTIPFLLEVHPRDFSARLGGENSTGYQTMKSMMGDDFESALYFLIGPIDIPGVARVDAEAKKLCERFGMNYFLM